MTFREASAASPHPTVVVTRDGSRTLVAPRGGEGYKSLAGALTEARHVYLEGSGVADRLHRQEPARVLEVGFGAGLLFLVSAALAQDSDAALDYVGLEQFPPPAELLAELRYDTLLAPSPLPHALTRWRGTLGQPAPSGQHHFTHERVRLSLVVADAVTLPVTGDFHAVYHDAFSPATNPRLWAPAFLAQLAAKLKPGGRLVTFSVAGPVRRALAAAGLKVSKRPGPPGGKREMLLAERPT